MVNIHRTPMRACTALNNSLYLASGGRVMRKVRSVPALLITVAGYRLLRRAAPSSASIESTKPARNSRGNSANRSGRGGTPNPAGRWLASWDGVGGGN